MKQLNQELIGLKDGFTELSPGQVFKLGRYSSRRDPMTTLLVTSAVTCSGAIVQ